MRDEPLVYTTSAGRTEGSVILKLTGPLTLSNMFTFQNDLRTMQPEALIVDLTDCPYMDSAGLGLIMNYYVSAQGKGHRLLLAGPNQRVTALLEMTKVNEILKTFTSVEEAEGHI